MTLAVSTRPTLVLLPGMDGTGKLFRGMTQTIPTDWPYRVISYPSERVMSYDQILQLVEDELASETQIILLAESFSGPVALRFAAKHSLRVVAVVLCASFVSPPLPSWLRVIIGRWLFSMAPPRLALRRLLLGADAPDALLHEVRSVIRTVAPAVMASRVKDVLRLDCRDVLRACTAPLMYLAGAQDVLVKQPSINVIKDIRPDVRIYSIDGPHLLLQREPAKAWAQIEAFLNEVASRCPANQTSNHPAA